MSSLREEKVEYASKEEILEWAKGRIRELEAELRVLRSIVSLLEDDVARPNVAEKVEEIKFGKRKIARLFQGDNYVRVVPLFRYILPVEVKEYLSSLEEEIRSLQARHGTGDESIILIIKDRPDGSIAEIRFENLYTTLEVLKVKAALRYSMEIMYQLYRASEKSED